MYGHYGNAKKSIRIAYGITKQTNNKKRIDMNSDQWIIEYSSPPTSSNDVLWGTGTSTTAELKLDIGDFVQSWEYLQIEEMMRRSLTYTTTSKKKQKENNNTLSNASFMHCSEDVSLWQECYPTACPLFVEETPNNCTPYTKNLPESQTTQSITPPGKQREELIFNLESYQFPAPKLIEDPNHLFFYPSQSMTDTPNTIECIGKKRRNSFSLKLSQKRKTSVCSTTSSSVSNQSSNVNTISNPKHLKRRRKYKKRKNSVSSNPAQSMMEFHFPVWTFHVE